MPPAVPRPQTLPAELEEALGTRHMLASSVFLNFRLAVRARPRKLLRPLGGQLKVFFVHLPGAPTRALWGVRQVAFSAPRVVAIRADQKIALTSFDPPADFAARAPQKFGICRGVF